MNVQERRERKNRVECSAQRRIECMYCCLMNGDECVCLPIFDICVVNHCNTSLNPPIAAAIITRLHRTMTLAVGKNELDKCARSVATQICCVLFYRENVTVVHPSSYTLGKFIAKQYHRAGRQHGRFCINGVNAAATSHHFRAHQSRYQPVTQHLH